MANLGKDEDKLAPEGMREELDAAESALAEATVLAEEVAPTEPVLDDLEPVVEAPTGSSGEPVVLDLSVPLQGLQLGKGDAGLEQVDDGAEKGEELERMNQRLRTLQGKYDAEVTQVHDQLRESQEKIRELEARRNDDMTPERVKQMSDAEFASRYDVNEEDLPLTRVSHEFTIIQNLEMQQMLKDQIVKPFEDKSASDAERQMRNDLGRLLPTWENTNDSQGFHDWLGERPARQKLLDAAGNIGDAQSAVDVFHDYLGVSGQASTHRVSLDSQIAPSPASSAVGVQARNGQQPAGPRPITYKEVERRLETLIRGVHPDGGKITETEIEKEKAVLDAITGGTSKDFVLT